MIRFILGILLVLGAVGTLDVDPEASILVQSLIASLGIFTMYFGVRAMNVRGR